ncbi:MAG: glycosyltransferase family 2 protein [Candidatus Paceibacterota bacterium]|jgi:glycosyltransferase involved in cell wall biosynthesis
MISVIIPSWKDPLLQKTIDSLLENSEGEIEIIAVFDGYIPEVPLKEDPRVKTLHLGKNRGMRGAINAGVSIASGEFIMRTDEHCSFGKGFDKILTGTFEDNWIVTPRRYFLNPEKWEVMDIVPVDYGDLKIVESGSGKKFSAVENKKLAEERKDIMIDETFGMQGSCWIMKKSWWDKVIGELQTEGYGPLYQDSHEMVFKTWKAGGKLMVNKNTWYAHKHRDFNRTHNNGTKENPSNNEACFKYSLDMWGDYYNELKQNGRFNYNISNE